MRILLFSISLLIGLQSLADTNPWPEPEHYMKHWYVMPSGPDDGEFVMTAGKIKRSETKNNIITVELDFEPKNEGFKQHGEWMRDISHVTIHVRLIQDDEMYDETSYGFGVKGVAAVSWSNYPAQSFEVNCDQVKTYPDYQTRSIKCWFNGFDSIKFTSGI